MASTVLTPPHRTVAHCQPQPHAMKVYGMGTTSWVHHLNQLFDDRYEAPLFDRHEPRPRDVGNAVLTPF